MRKFFIITIVALMVSSIFAGGTGEQDDVITLRLWMGIPPENGPQLVVDAFNEEFKDKGIQVEYERYVNDDSGNIKLETNLLAGNAIDVYASYGGLVRVAKRVESGMAMDLTEFLERDGIDPVELFGETAVELTKINGKLYSLPTTLTKPSLLVNKNMFDAAGIEIPERWTYEEFREVAKKLTHGEGQDKVYGMFWNSTQNFYEMQARLSSRILGGDWMYKEGGRESNLNDPIIVKTIGLINDTMNVDHSAPTHVDTVTQRLTMENMFLEEKAAMVVDNFIIRTVKDLEQYPHDFVTVFVPYPLAEEIDDPYSWAVYGDQISINPKTKYPEAAWEFVKWYATKGVEYMAVGGRIGLAKCLDKDHMLDLFFAGYEDIIDVESAKKYFLYNDGDKLTSMTISTKAPEIQKVLNEAGEAIMTGTKGVQEALDEAKIRADEFLKTE